MVAAFGITKVKRVSLFSELTATAEQSDAEAQYTLGTIYSFG
jgi:hypothetical protein|tara:strand:- start:579 stop:704 length:126 start_codon:yes stop_codon:yes gene_type:complete